MCDDDLDDDCVGTLLGEAARQQKDDHSTNQDDGDD